MGGVKPILMVKQWFVIPEPGFHPAYLKSIGRLKFQVIV